MRTCTSQHRRTVIEKRHHLATESCFIDQDSLVGVATFTTPKPLACSLATLESPSAVEQRSIYEHVQLRKTERVFVLVSPPSSTSSPYVTLSPKHISTSTSNLQFQVPNQTGDSNTTTHDERLKRKHTQTTPSPTKKLSLTRNHQPGHESRLPIRLHLNGARSRHRHRLASQQLHLNQSSLAQWSHQRR